MARIYTRRYRERPQWSRSREGDRSCPASNEASGSAPGRNGAGLVKETGGAPVLGVLHVRDLAAMEPVS